MQDSAVRTFLLFAPDGRAEYHPDRHSNAEPHANVSGDYSKCRSQRCS